MAPLSGRNRAFAQRCYLADCPVFLLRHHLQSLKRSLPLMLWGSPPNGRIDFSVSTLHCSLSFTGLNQESNILQEVALEQMKCFLPNIS